MFRVVAKLVLVQVLIASGLVLAPSALAAQSPYKNCKTFNAKYPTGIARSKIEAEAAVVRGFERPSVNRKAYRKARKANKRLNTPRDGVLCEVPRPVTAPSEPRDVTTTLEEAQAISLQWSAPADDGNAPITGYVVRGSGAITVIGNRARVTGLSPDTQYAFEIRAVNVAGEGAPASFTASTTPEAAPTPTPTTPDSSATRYRNCTAARAAGVTPIRRDTNPALYSANTHLDRDKDGVACE